MKLLCPNYAICTDAYECDHASPHDEVTAESEADDNPCKREILHDCPQCVEWREALEVK